VGIVNLGNLLAVSPSRAAANLLICGPGVGRARLKIVEICLNLTMPIRATVTGQLLTRQVLVDDIVPEPVTMVLVGIGTVGMIWWRRTRKSVR
jgi:PEP-CTERM motif